MTTKFECDQRVYVKNHAVRGVEYRNGTVFRINEDGSAILRLDGPGEPREAEAWPEDCSAA